MNQILESYYSVSNALADDFYAEFLAGVEKVLTNPNFFHFDACGLRRCNLRRFPYHFLYDSTEDKTRIWVLRHHRRNSSFGTKRFE